jgi:hypothetical protein
VFSYFSDSEESITNGFTAGVWAVSVDSGGDTAAREYTGLSADQTDSDTWTVTNTGTIPAYVDMAISVSADGTGELEDHMFASLHFSGGPDVCTDTAIKDIGGDYDQNLVLAAGQSQDLVLDWYVDSAYFPDEHDIVTVTITFDIKPAP